MQSARSAKCTTCFASLYFAILSYGSCMTNFRVGRCLGASNNRYAVYQATSRTETRSDGCYLRGMVIGQNCGVAR